MSDRREWREYWSCFEASRTERNVVQISKSPAKFPRDEDFTKHSYNFVYSPFNNSQLFSRFVSTKIYVSLLLVLLACQELMGLGLNPLLGPT